MLNDYYSPNEVASKMHLTRKTVYGLMRKGLLGYSKFGTGRGSRIRISTADVEKYMADTRRKPFAKEA